jgi:hypothetical protein
VAIIGQRVRVMLTCSEGGYLPPLPRPGAAPHSLTCTVKTKLLIMTGNYAGRNGGGMVIARRGARRVHTIVNGSGSRCWCA